MFGKKKNKLFLTITVDDSVDIRAVRDFLVEVVLKKLSFIRHVTASFGLMDTNTVAQDYETARKYEAVAEGLVEDQLERHDLEEMKRKLSDLQDEIDEKISLG